MKKVAIIGSNGMLGSDLVTYLRSYYTVTAINRDNYASYCNKTFDIVVNANGNSKRFWANKNIIEDFALSTTSVYKSLFDFYADCYIYISTSDVYENHSSPLSTKENQKINSKKLSPYGFHKYLSELIVKKYSKNYVILRSSLMLGTKLKKGPLHDILEKKPLFISKQSKLQMITTKEIARCIQFFVEKKIMNKTFNIGGKNVVPFKDIHKFFNFPVLFSKDAEKQHYEMNVSKLHTIYPLKTSQIYLQDFLNSLQSHSS